MKLRHAFQAAAAAGVITIAGGAGYLVTEQAHHALAATPMPPLSLAARTTAQQYSLRLTGIMADQQQLDQTSDEEDAAHVLLEDKKRFATEAVLDRGLSERDLAALALRFNANSKEDGIRFRFYNFAPETAARRNECLRVTPATDAQFGDDAYAHAQRVEECMITKTQNSLGEDIQAAQLGGVAGGLAAGAFMVGRLTRRKSAPKKK